MQSWFVVWTVQSSKHEELLREAERERLFNRLRAALQAGAGAQSRPASELSSTRNLAPGRLELAGR